MHWFEIWQTVSFSFITCVLGMFLGLESGVRYGFIFDLWLATGLIGGGSSQVMETQKPWGVRSRQCISPYVCASPLPHQLGWPQGSSAGARRCWWGTLHVVGHGPVGLGRAWDADCLWCTVSVSTTNGCPSYRRSIFGSEALCASDMATVLGLGMKRCKSREQGLAWTSGMWGCGLLCWL